VTTRIAWIHVHRSVIDFFTLVKVSSSLGQGRKSVVSHSSFTMILALARPEKKRYAVVESMSAMIRHEFMPDRVLAGRSRIPRGWLS